MRFFLACKHCFRCYWKAIGGKCWLAFRIGCYAPVTIGTRFCYRCHLIAIAHSTERIRSLERQLEIAKGDLARLLTENEKAPR
jgi:hypothetical protein